MPATVACLRVRLSSATGLLADVRECSRMLTMAGKTASDWPLCFILRRPTYYAPNGRNGSGVRIGGRRDRSFGAGLRANGRKGAVSRPTKADARMTPMADNPPLPPNKNGPRRARRNHVRRSKRIRHAPSPPAGSPPSNRPAGAHTPARSSALHPSCRDHPAAPDTSPAPTKPQSPR